MRWVDVEVDVEEVEVKVEGQGQGQGQGEGYLLADERLVPVPLVGERACLLQGQGRLGQGRSWTLRVIRSKGGV